MTRRLALVLLLAMPMASFGVEKAAKRSYLGVMIAAGKEKGTFEVLSVLEASPAQKAGLKGGDVLLKIDGAKPDDLATAVKVIRALKAGRKATLLVRRDGKELAVVVPRETEMKANGTRMNTDATD